MFLVMGIQDKIKSQDHSNNVPCHVCDGMHGFELISKYNYFHLFFLPVWRWGYDYSLRCKACGSFYTIKAESYDKCKTESPELSYWDLEPVNIPVKQTKSLECKACGFILDSDFEFCPKCGTKITDDEKSD